MPVAIVVDWYWVLTQSSTSVCITCINSSPASIVGNGALGGTTSSFKTNAHSVMVCPTVPVADVATSNSTFT